MTDQYIPLPTEGLNVVTYDPNRKHDSCAIVSGGLDSVTLAYDMVQRGYKPHLLSFNYGQRHKKEIQYAHVAARQFGLRHSIIDLSSLTHLISNSALTSDHKHAEGNDIIDVPEGHYAEDNMSVTVVPNRNMIMLSIAAGVAVNYGYEAIGTGVHGGDHFQYPDCRPEFIYATNDAIFRGNLGFGKWDDANKVIFAPYLHSTKQDIAVRAFELSVPIHLTWSCYKGDTNHCGRCGTCVERLEAIAGAQQVMMKRYPGTEGVWVDRSDYDDDEYWKTVVK